MPSKWLVASCSIFRPTAPTSTPSRGRSEKTSESEVLQIPRIGHKALILLSQWMVNRNEAEATKHSMDGFAEGSAPTPRGADQRPDTTECLDGSGDRS